MYFVFWFVILSWPQGVWIFWFSTTTGRFGYCLPTATGGRLGDVWAHRYSEEFSRRWSILSDLSPQYHAEKYRNYFFGNTGTKSEMVSRLAFSLGRVTVPKRVLTEILWRSSSPTPNTRQVRFFVFYAYSIAGYVPGNPPTWSNQGVSLLILICSFNSVITH